MIALTGATGFVGSTLAARLKEKSLPFRCLVRRDSKNLERLRSFQTAEVDFSSVSSLASSLEGCETVIHVLGLINGTEEVLQRVNVDYTRNLAQASAQKKVKRFIFVSSVAANMRHGPYGLSKAAAEEEIKKSGVPYLFFRPAWIFGPNDINNSAMMIRTLKNFPVVPLLGGGTFKIQPVYVDDAVTVILQGLDFPRLNSAYNIAGKEQVSLKTILEVFARHMKVKRLFFPVPLKPLQAFLRGYLAVNPRTKLPAKQILELDKHEAFDISETQRDFGFDPIRFEEGAERMFRERVCAG